MIISDRLSSEKVIGGIVLLIIIAAGAALYFCSFKKTSENGLQTNNQLNGSTASVSDQSTTIDNSTPTEQEPEILAPIENVPPTPKPTQEELDKIDISNWKTYTNADYGYEIKYPSDWSIITRGDYGVHFLASETPKFNSDELGEGDIWISMQKLGTYYAPEWYFKETSITINENKATLYTGVNGGQDTQYPDISYTILEVKKDSKEISINYPDYLEEKDGAKYIGIYYKMLDTFRFDK